MNFVIGFIAYLLISRAAMRLLTGNLREAVLAVLNVTGVCFFLFDGKSGFGVYLVLITGLFLTVKWFSKNGGAWIAFFAPLVALVFFRYLPCEMNGKNGFGIPALVGISYLAFRCSRLVLEVRNGAAQKPNFFEYLNFAFFLPTMTVGPINTYANYRRGFAQEPYDVPVGRALLRILVGAVKYLFLGGLCNQLSYSGWLLDGQAHLWIDLPVAMLFYYLYLYLNFSGFCDMAIGSAGLIGIPVPENFEKPFGARNVKEFWNRWHITLSFWMRDFVFVPLSKSLVGRMGIQRANHAIALTITVVFLLVGIWHGVGWNFAAYGAIHAFGVVTNHYYTIFLKKRLGRDRFKAYNENPWIHAVAVGVTFCYCGASLIFFANTFPQLKSILAALR